MSDTQPKEDSGENEIPADDKSISVAMGDNSTMSDTQPKEASGENEIPDEAKFHDGLPKITLRDGVAFHTLPNGRSTAASIDELPNFKLRDDDILIIAFPKSGTHWLNEIIGMLQQGNAQPLKAEKESWMIDFNGIDVLDALPSPRILNTHYWAQHIPTEIMKKCKLFHVMRNPKDIAVSGYCHMCLMIQAALPDKPLPQFNDHLKKILAGKGGYGSWFGYEQKYEQLFKENTELDPLNLYYEDMIKDPMTAIKKVSAHLGKSYDDDFLMQVLDACNIDKMRGYAKTRTKFDWFPGDPAVGAQGLYRKGKIGDWKNWFTVADNELFDKVYEEKMEGSSLKLQFE